MLYCDCSVTENFEAFMISGKETVVYVLFSDNFDEEHKKTLFQEILSVPRPDSFCRGSLNSTQIILIEIQLWQT